MSVRTALKVAMIEVEDRLRYHPAMRGMLGTLTRARDALARKSTPQEVARSVRALTAAQRLTANPGLIASLDRAIHDRLDAIDLRKVEWGEFSPFPVSPHMTRATFLKPYKGPDEPGVLFSAFESEWINFFCHVDIERFASRYTLVVAPTSAPYNIANYALPRIYGRPLFSLINHEEDVGIIPMIGANYRMVPLYTSHWVNPAVCRPAPRTQRPIDIIMIAAWGKVKRHHRLLRALRDLPRSTKVLLIGQNQDGRSVETIVEEARHYGVADRFETLTNAPHHVVVERLAQAKVSLLLSMREGSAVVIPESLFADTPAGLYRDAYNGSRSFINEETGMLLDHAGLAGQLARFLDNHASYRARTWAEANISCYRSTERMNAILKHHALAAGQSWTEDIRTLTWQPDPVLVHEPDREATRADRQWMMDEFGVQVGKVKDLAAVRTPAG